MSASDPRPAGSPVNLDQAFARADDGITRRIDVIAKSCSPQTITSS